MLPELQAQRHWLAIEAATVPHMKQEDASGVLRRLQRLLSGTKKAQSVLGALAAAGIPTVTVPKATGRSGTRRRGKA